MMTLRILGVDACKGGWVAVELHDGSFAAAHVAATLPALLAEHPEIDVVGVDMPLGLPDRGWREADIAAAAVLGTARATVFRVPPAPVWHEKDYESAVRRCRELTGGLGFSRQAWGLREKLREANDYRAKGLHRLYEVHPEVSFRAMAGDGRELSSKKTWRGQTQRQELLHTVGIRLPADLGEAGRAAPDDVLDAAAAAWTAHRIGTDQAGRHPKSPDKQASPDTVAIWY